MRKALTNLLEAFTTLDTALDTRLAPSEPYPLDPGAIRFTKPVELVTPQDILDAYHIPDIFQDIPVIDATWEEMLLNAKYEEHTRAINPKPFIWTARGAKLIAGNTAQAGMKGVDDTTAQALSGSDKSFWDAYSTAAPTMQRIATYNAERLKYIENQHKAIDEENDANAGSSSHAPHPDCVGLKLERIYPVLYGWASVSNRKPSSYHNLVFSPKRDFIIDGEVGGKAVGGFMSRYWFLATTNSLVLRKARFMRKDGQGYYQIYVDASKGIDQLQVEDCVFEQVGATNTDTTTRKGHPYAAFYIYVYFQNREPRITASNSSPAPAAASGTSSTDTITDTSSATPRQETSQQTAVPSRQSFNPPLSTTNVIRDCLVSGNIVYGHDFIVSEVARFANSHRIVNNTFYGGEAEDNLENGFPYHALRGCAGTFVSHTTWNEIEDVEGGVDEYGNKNDWDYTYLMGYYSCIAWVAGNKFYGPERIVANRRPGVTLALTAAAFECGQVCYVHNVFKNFVTKHVIRDGGLDKTRHYERHGTYDTYNNVVKLWFVNNHVENVVNLSFRKADDCGAFKGKGVFVPYELRDGWKFARGLRYYSKNTFTFDKQWLIRKWNEATKVGFKREGFDPYDPYTSYHINRKNEDWKPSDYLIEDKYGEMFPMPEVAMNEERFQWLVGERTYDTIFDQQFEDSVSVMFDEIIPFSYKAVKGVPVHYIPAVAYDYVVKGNTFDFGDFCIGGMMDTSSINAVNFTLENNNFIARRMPSLYSDNGTDKVLWSSKRMMVGERQQEYIFNIMPWDLHDSVCENGAVKKTTPASIVVRNNHITVADFVLDGTTTPSKVTLLRVKWNSPVDIYKDVTGYRVNIGRPATILIENNIIDNAEDGHTENDILLHIQNISSGNISNLEPT